MNVKALLEFYLQLVSGFVKPAFLSEPHHTICLDERTNKRGGRTALPHNDFDDSAGWQMHNEGACGVAYTNLLQSSQTRVNTNQPRVYYYYLYLLHETNSLGACNILHCVGKKRNPLDNV